jgi:NADH-quinone oxidoreductase subunit E
MDEMLISEGVDTVRIEANFSEEPDELIAILQYYQIKDGYISQDAVRQIAQQLKCSETRIYGVASFYSQFRFVQPGKNTIRICLGTACHVQSGQQLCEEVESVLGISPGETTSDRLFTLQEVACLGCCAQAPVVEINGKIFGKMTREKLRKVLKTYAEL